jgi:membrane fusion protein (multidrug efflux system)
VADNQEVKSGDLLVKLDPSDYNVALQRAQANLDQSKAQVLQAQTAITQAHSNYEQAEAQVAQAQAQNAQANARFEVAGIDYGRNEGLYSKDYRAVAKADVDTTKSNLDATHAALDAAAANVQAAQASAQAAKSMIESREAELVVAQAAVETNQANVDDAKLQLSYCWVLSPCDGRVSRKTVETGQRLSPGQAVMAITEDDVWVLANLKETQLAKVRVGQRVKLPVDAFKNHPFVGHVNSIQAGSGATYALLPPDNATGNFTKIVQRVPVKVTFDADSIKGFKDLVVPGLSVIPVIDLSSTSDRGDYVAAGSPAPPPRGSRQQ